MIRQGEIYWVDLAPPSGSGPGFRHPHVVVQNDIFNQSRIQTVVVCALASNMKRAAAPGNVSLGKGEANLEKPSVVNISQIMTVDKADLCEKIGSLSKGRIKEVLEGVGLLLEPADEVRGFPSLS